MADTTKIGGYEAMILPVGYIFTEQVPSEVWEVAAEHEIDGSRLINVDAALEVLEDRQAEQSLTEPEQKLFDLCKAAELMGLQDIVVNPS